MSITAATPRERLFVEVCCWLVWAGLGLLAAARHLNPHRTQATPTEENP